MLNGIIYASNSSSVLHQEVCTVRTAMVYAIQDCGQLSSGLFLIIDRRTIRNM